MRGGLTLTASLCPRMPVAHRASSPDMSHTPTTLSCPPVTTHLPSSLAAMHNTAPLCPPPSARSVLCASVSRSKRRTAPFFIDAYIGPAAVIAMPVGGCCVLLKCVLLASAAE